MNKFSNNNNNRYFHCTHDMIKNCNGKQKQFRGCTYIFHTRRDSGRVACEDELQFRCKIHLPSWRQGCGVGGRAHKYVERCCDSRTIRSNRARGNRVETWREFQWVGPKLLMPITALSRSGKTEEETYDA